MGVKVIVLVLGAVIANLWEAVIAYVSIALLAILNAVRIKRMKLQFADDFSQTNVNNYTISTYF